MSVFLVEDSDIDRHIFKNALKVVDNSMELHMAGNGQEALSALSATDADIPQVIFTDLNMPFMGGKDFLAALRTNKLLRNIPVVVYSASSSAVDKKATIENGAVHYMEKKTSFNELCTELKSILPLFFL